MGIFLKLPTPQILKKNKERALSGRIYKHQVFNTKLIRNDFNILPGLYFASVLTLEDIIC
jgi:hypothetical protein